MSTATENTIIDGDGHVVVRRRRPHEHHGVARAVARPHRGRDVRARPVDLARDRRAGAARGALIAHRGARPGGVRAPRAARHRPRHGDPQRGRQRRRPSHAIHKVASAATARTGSSWRGSVSMPNEARRPLTSEAMNSEVSVLPDTPILVTASWYWRQA